MVTDENRDDALAVWNPANKGWERCAATFIVASTQYLESLAWFANGLRGAQYDAYSEQLAATSAIDPELHLSRVGTLFGAMAALVAWLPQYEGSCIRLLLIGMTDPLGLAEIAGRAFGVAVIVKSVGVGMTPMTVEDARTASDALTRHAVTYPDGVMCPLTLITRDSVPNLRTALRLLFLGKTEGEPGL